MEENTTKRKASAINITIYGNGLNGRAVSEQLNSFIQSADNTAYEFVFRIVSIDKALNENDRTTHLFIILHATNEDNDASVNKLTQKLTTNNQPNIMINSTSANFTEKSRETLTDLAKALELGFTTADFADINNKGINIDTIKQQLDIFKNGITKAQLKKPALLGDGIFPLPKEEALKYATVFDDNKDNFKLTKFVPASGAASRMFKFLLEFMDEFNPDK